MIEFGGLSIFTGSIAEVVSRVGRWIRLKQRAYICVTGAHGIVESQSDAAVRAAHKHASLIVPDGMPLVYLARASHPETERIYGPDLMKALFREADKRQWRVFFYGTTEKTLETLTSRLSQKHPNLLVVGMYAPPFRALTQKEKARMIALINAARPQLLFVGMSTPKQERWMFEFSSRLRPMTLIGVGAAFDFLAGTKNQAPRWVQRSGLEWLYRLLQEPKRLGPRYLTVVTRFLLLAFRYAIMR